MPVGFVPTRRIQSESPGAHALFEAGNGVGDFGPASRLPSTAGLGPSSQRSEWSYDAELSTLPILPLRPLGARIAQDPPLAYRWYAGHVISGVQPNQDRIFGAWEARDRFRIRIPADVSPGHDRLP